MRIEVTAKYIYVQRGGCLWRQINGEVRLVLELSVGRESAVFGGYFLGVAARVVALAFCFIEGAGCAQSQSADIRPEVSFVDVEP